ncbi:ABC transporter permease [Cohnella silvisoli]|uniref:ABC transporter permease subunit n=1 Tax=Cohnella silvisoli TaxID=2873699 RepID=A0ABV1KVS9_9BACL|nr:ABC transporter permease subunit [Cohnella silvisoli]MCD9023237.1 ABC transporter permease subunit [Cohnella silvisoli]
MTTRKWIREMPLHVMLIPTVVLLIAFSYVPMTGIAIAFQNFYPGHNFFSSPWVGWENFQYMLQLPGTLQVLYNTLFIAVLKIVANLVVPIVMALLLNEVRKMWFKRSVQTIVYLPYFISWVLLGGILVDILSPSQGIVNEILKAVGLPSVYFLGDNHWFPFTLVATNTWKEFGFNTIVFLAALTGINPSLYEAACIDGASRWKQTLKITLPGLLPIIILLATLSLGNVLNAGFDQVFNLYNASVYESGDIIDTMVYRIGMGDGQYSVATAVGLFKSVVSFILISVSYLLAYRFANYRIF